MKKLAKYLVGIIIIAALAVGGYFAYDFAQKSQLLATTTSAADEGFVHTRDDGHVHTLEQVVGFSKKKDRSGILIVGVETTYPPLAFARGDGAVVGFDIDVVKQIAKKLNKELIIQPILWEDKLAEINSGRVDLLASGFTYVKSREKNYEMSHPYLANRIVVAVSQDSPIATMDELGSKVIGIQSGSSYVLELIKEFSDSQGQGVAEVKADFVDAGMALSSMLQGEVDAVVLESSVAAYYSQHSPNTFRILDGELASTDIVFATKKGSTELINQINRALQDISKSEAFSKSYTRWLGNKK